MRKFAIVVRMATSTLEWTYSDRLRKLRKATGLGQGDFASLIGARSGTLANWEAGSNPRQLVEMTQVIEEQLEIPGIAAWLLGVGPPPEIPDEWRPRQDSNLRPRGHRCENQLSLLDDHDEPIIDLRRSGRSGAMSRPAHVESPIIALAS